LTPVSLARANRARGFIASAYQAYRSALAIEPRSVPLRKEINAIVRAHYAPGEAERFLVAEEPPSLARPRGFDDSPALHAPAHRAPRRR
jgi:hypothetical protein